MSEAAVPGGFARLLSDDRLARRAVGGDQRAFAAIFRRYHQPLYRFCLAIVGNPEDAQDALQNTMIKVLRSLPGEERKIELKPWLYRIAHNESIDLLRRRRETRQLDIEQAAPGSGLAEDAATRERLRRLIEDMRELPERQREVLVLRELSGLEFDEIGAALDTSGAVARQTLYEARQSLHQMEQGREMRCEQVMLALSDGDGRVTRRRDVRAHLRACPECRRFGEEIQGRRRDFAALSPLPVAAAAGMLHGLIGGGKGAGSGIAATLGGGAAKSIGVSAATKGLATAAVVAAIGATAADRAGVIHLGLPGDRGAHSSSSESPGAASGSGSTPASSGPAGNAGAGSAGPHGEASQTGDAGHGVGRQSGAGKEHAAAGTNAHAGSQHPQSRAPVGSKAQGPQEHPHGLGHEKQHPEVASKGQEAAAAHRASHPSQGAEHSQKPAPKHQAAPAKSEKAPPTHPEHPAHPAPAEESPSPPAAAPDGAASGQEASATASPPPEPGGAGGGTGKKS